MADLEPAESEVPAAETSGDTELKSDDADAGEDTGTAADEDQHASEQTTA